jgi:site-specific DNA-adenine methylase
VRLTNYEFAEDFDKIQWLNSIKMNVGLPYFGGKSVIGRYIFNNIFNLSVEMKKQGHTPEIFIDAFTGGGKIALSVPKGWYDTIVINDMDYGVYSYYKCCKENPIALIYMIEKIGEIMSEDVFYLSAYIRRFGKGVEKWDGGGTVKEDEEIDSLAAGALTYWVTSSAYNNITAPGSTTYNLAPVKRDPNGNPVMDNGSEVLDGRIEQENIKKVIATAKKRIPKLHEQLNSMDYRIENLDYRELIKKYNGHSYVNLQKEVQPKEIELASKNKLWYFDPPYHPWCLYAGEDAPYADTFSVKLANEMVKILAGKREKEFGKLSYFIKSDYDPKNTLQIAMYNLGMKDLKDLNAEKEIDDKKKIEDSPERVKWYKELIYMENGDKKHLRELLCENKKGTDIDKQIEECSEGMVSRLFEDLEKFPCCKICVGGFDKGAIRGDGSKSVGQEYIWCRGFPRGYEDIEGVAAKE